ncbi:MAG TPA: TMEM175 family protein [Myxococcaceae bacterium]|nr:TMEM175 family protein [Myxococcaceae bacterium]
MKASRLEAFSDGVLAIVITIMVLELKVPHGSDLHALGPVVPVFLSYALSFVYVGIYWNNHHHLFHATREIGGGVMWANLALLFCLSLIPVTTAWVGDHPHAPWPAAVYGMVLLLCGMAWWLLERTIIAHEGPRSDLARAVGRRLKENLSPVGYGLGIALAFIRPWLAQLVYAGVALAWIVPDRRIEAVLRGR